MIKKPNSPFQRTPSNKQISKPDNYESDSEIKEKRRRMITATGADYTFGQMVLWAAIFSSLAAALTALAAVCVFSISSEAAATANNDVYSDHLVASATQSVVRARIPPAAAGSRARILGSTTSASFLSSSSTVGSTAPQEQDRQQLRLLELAPPKQFRENVITAISVLPIPAPKDIGIRPMVAWLMSFPNSGTSFTLHMTREASNTTTATNYALEGEIKDKPSVAAIPGPAGANGPWLELIPNRFTNIPTDVILTKTHCKGFCSGRNCGPEKTVQTVRSFMVGCLSGTRAVQTKRGLEKVTTTGYSPSLVSRAIHIFRHPLDNVVARFHLEWNVHSAKGNHKYTQLFPKTSTGFRKWCAVDDENQGLLKSRFIDSRLRKKLVKVPCFNDFYRYVQWHNLAFSMAHEMNLPTMLLHYSEYSSDFEGTRDRVLNFLGLPLTGKGIQFHDGKVYRNYYSNEQKTAIRDLLQELSSVETWEQLKGYDFEIGTETETSAISAIL